MKIERLLFIILFFCILPNCKNASLGTQRDIEAAKYTQNIFSNDIFLKLTGDTYVEIYSQEDDGEISKEKAKKIFTTFFDYRMREHFSTEKTAYTYMNFFNKKKKFLFQISQYNGELFFSNTEFY